MKRIDTFTGLFLSKKLYGFLWFSYKLSVNWTKLNLAAKIIKKTQQAAFIFDPFPVLFRIIYFC